MDGPKEPLQSLNEMFGDGEPLEPLEETLSNTIELVVRAVGCDAASLSLSEDGRLRTIEATEEAVVEADRTQYEANWGPCVQAADRGETYEISDMSNDERWKEFSAKAFELGWRSSLSVPLRVETKSIGALNLYARSTHAFGPDKERVASLFASRAAIGLAHAQLLRRSRDLVSQLEVALASRDVIGQAKGILMEREGINSEEAFRMLVQASQHSNTKLRDVAEELVRATEGDENLTDH